MVERAATMWMNADDDLRKLYEAERATFVNSSPFDKKPLCAVVLFASLFLRACPPCFLLSLAFSDILTLRVAFFLSQLPPLLLVSPS